MSTTSAYVTTHTIAPIGLLDVPMIKQGFEILDDDGMPTGDYMTIKQKCTDPVYGLNGGAYMYQTSPDGDFVSFGYEFSPSRAKGINGVDDYTRAHGQAEAMGLVEVSDFTLPLQPNNYVILDQSSWQEFMSVNPTWQSEEA